MGKGAKTKGYIYIYHAKKKKLMKFIYNPEEFEYGFSSEYAMVQSPGGPLPLYQMVGGNEKTINLTLLVDGRERHSDTVQRWVEQFEKFHPTYNKNMNSFKKTADALFCMGPFVKKVIIKEVNWRFILFDKHLNPTRAELSLAMEVYKE